MAENVIRIRMDTTSLDRAGRGSTDPAAPIRIRRQESEASASDRVARREARRTRTVDDFITGGSRRSTGPKMSPVGSSIFAGQISANASAVAGGGLGSAAVGVGVGGGGDALKKTGAVIKGKLSGVAAKKTAVSAGASLATARIAGARAGLKTAVGVSVAKGAGAAVAKTGLLATAGSLVKASGTVGIAVAGVAAATYVGRRVINAVESLIRGAIETESAIGALDVRITWLEEAVSSANEFIDKSKGAIIESAGFVFSPIEGAREMGQLNPDVSAGRAKQLQTMVGRGERADAYFKDRLKSKSARDRDRLFARALLQKSPN